MRIDTKLYGDCRGMLCAFQHCMALSGSLPNVCFRLGFGPKVPGACQFVNHGPITVNGRVVDIPSYQCRAGDVIAVRERKASRLLVEANLAFPGISNIPPPGTRQAEVHRQGDQQVRAGMGGPRDQRTAGGGILQPQSFRF